MPPGKDVVVDVGVRFLEKAEQVSATGRPSFRRFAWKPSLTVICHHRALCVPAATTTTRNRSRHGRHNRLIVAQSTSQCGRCCCFQPPINWVLLCRRGTTSNRGRIRSTCPRGVGSTRSESSFCQRTFSGLLPGCRAIRYVHHSGAVPDSIRGENRDWFTCQVDDTPRGMSEHERQRDVIAAHEKDQTCGAYFIVPLCWNLPNLHTKDAQGNAIGTTQYVCDECLFVPKFDVTDDRGGRVVYHLRPDVCCLGCCVRCRCGGKRGKCFRVPFVIRDPETKAPLKADVREGKAAVTALWAGWKHECCSRKNAYHVAFPAGSTPEEKCLWMSSCLSRRMTTIELHGTRAHPFSVLYHGHAVYVAVMEISLSTGQKLLPCDQVLQTSSFVCK